MAKSSFIQDFKAFTMKGNVVDMAVGIIIGAAFGKIVSTFVSDVLMPPLGLLIGNVDFSDLKWTIKEAVGDAQAISINYGLFIQTIIDFVIVAFSIFVLIRFLAKLNRKNQQQEAATPPPPPAPSQEEILLTEIRDLLKNNQK